MSKEKRTRYFWCPTCKKPLTIETDSPVICGSPVCAECNGQIWRKDKEWFERNVKSGVLKDGQ